MKNLRTVVQPPSPGPSPPEAGGEGVGEVAGLRKHKALNRFSFSPSPPMRERVRVREQKVDQRIYTLWDEA